MHDITRRNFSILGALGTAAAFGLSGPMAFIGAAQAEEPTQPFNKFKVGAIEVTTVYDGVWEKKHDPKLVKNASLEDVKKALVTGGLTDAFVPIPFTVTVVRLGDRTIMFDASTGGQVVPEGNGKAGLALEANMKAAGIEPASINTIIVTHFHPDHIFGLMAPETNAQVFPNAEIIVPATEFKFWTDAGVFTKLPAPFHGLAKRIQATLPSWKNVSQFEGDVEVAPGIYAVATNGHTPGHTSYVLGSGADQLWVTGDITNVRALNMRNPGWHLAFDGDPDKAEASRRKMFEAAIAEKAVLTGYHWGMPGAGTIARDGNGFALSPAT